MSLPSQHEPLRLADGRVVYPGGDFADARRPQPVDTTEIKATPVRRQLSELPGPPKQMNAIGAILSYVLFGLDDEDIAGITKLTAVQVYDIRNGDMYRQMHEAIVRSVLAGESDVVREVLSRNSRIAANTMVEALQSGTRADRMAAARDILDRSGFRPADVVEHRHRMDGGLVIEVVKRDENAKVPTIDMGSV